MGIRNLFHRKKNPGKKVLPGHYFIFRCPSCMKEVTIKEGYEEDREYECPVCHRKDIVPETAVSRKTMRFTFQCPHCGTVQRTYDDIQYSDDVYDVSECDCPGCGEHVVIRTESASHYFIRQQRMMKG